MTTPIRLRCPLHGLPLPLSARKLTAAQREWIVHECIYHESDAAKISRNWGLNKDTVHKWVSRYRFGHTFHDGNGRPPLLDEEQKKDLRKLVEGSELLLPVEDFDSAMAEKFQETSRKHNRWHAEPTEVTKKKYRSEMGFRVVNAETTTNARAEACADALNMISFAAMNYHFVEKVKVNPNLMLNMDATQYTVGGKGGAQRKVIMAKGMKGQRKALPSKGYNASLPFSIKYFCLMSAGGSLFDPVYVLADDSMQADKFHAFEVPGLGIGTDVGSVGWVVYCKTRAGNAAFFSWLYTTILTKAVLKIRSAYGLRDDEMAWFKLDGEPIQIAKLQTDELIQHLNELAIAAGKLPASSTEWAQECDIGDGFRASKGKLKTISDEDVEHLTAQRATLRAVIDAHILQASQEHAAAGLSTSYKPLSAPHIRAAIFGLLRIQRALQLSVTRDTVEESWRKTGTYPFDVQKILNHCTKKIPFDDCIKIEQSLPKLAAEMVKEGELSAAAISKITGIDFGDAPDRDNLILHRRRGCILTNAKLVAREQKKREEKELLEAVKATKPKRVYKKKTPTVSASVAAPAAEPSASLTLKIRLPARK